MSAFRPCHFFIIGAMKAGTTTLHDDLSKHPNIFLPTLKEPGYYVGPEFGGPAHLPNRAALRSDYIRLFSAAQETQIRGESSTYYSQAGLHDGVPERILKDSGPNTKFIYLLREPTARIISHYKHDTSRNYIQFDSIEDALNNYDPLTLFSRYAFQVEKFQRVFPKGSIMLLQAEHYFKNRKDCVADVLEFLGQDAQALETEDFDTHKNSAANARNYGSFAKAIRRSSLYHRYLKPILPKSVFGVASQVLSKPGNTAGHEIDVAAVKQQVANLLPDEDQLLYENVSRNGGRKII